MILYFGSAFAARGVLADLELGKLVSQFLKRSEQPEHQRRNDVGVPIMDNVMRFWLGLPSWNKFSVLHKVRQIMSVSSTSGCYRKDFVDDNFSANSYNVVLGAVIAVRSYFEYRGVSLSNLLAHGKIAACREATSKYTRLDDPLMTSPWEDLSVQSWGGLVAQYAGVLRNSVPAVVHPRADEHTWKFLR